MDTKAVARAFTDLCKKGELAQAGDKFWAEDVVSREAMEGEMAMLKGRKAVEGKGQWWYANNTVHEVKAEGPYVHGNQFVVRFKMDLTPKGGERMNLDEVGLYTLKNGLIAEEQFFYAG